MPPELYHFTCRHGHRMIGRYNCVLTPQQGAWPIVWLTDEAEPDFEAMGLGDPVMLKCDRREFRYVVAAGSSCRQWLGSPERAALDADHRAVLEEYAKPEHWWITAEPVRAAWDRSWQTPGTEVSDFLGDYRRAQAARGRAARNRRGRRQAPITGVRIDPGRQR